MTQGIRKAHFTTANFHSIDTWKCFSLNENNWLKNLLGKVESFDIFVSPTLQTGVYDSLLSYYFGTLKYNSKCALFLLIIWNARGWHWTKN